MPVLARKHCLRWKHISREIRRKVRGLVLVVMSQTYKLFVLLAGGDAGIGQYVVVVRFKAVGNAPIMKQNFYKITSSNRFQTVIQFLRKELGWKQGDALVC